MILLYMIFMHIVDDYYLQGVLANLKQKEWWTKHKDYTDYYKYDYLMALFMHAFSWSFMIHLPLIYFGYVGLIPSILINMFIHAWIDDNKANMKTINLVIDQTLHLVQIVITYILLVML